MNSFSPLQSTLPWWIEIHISVPQQTYHLGPFNSREEAKIFRGTHVKALCHKEASDIIAMIKQH